MHIAITREVSRSIGDCELTFRERVPIDVERARRQHREYESALRRVGIAVLSLPEEPELPDAVFVEDTALVLAERAVITRPGADSRLPETRSIADVLGRFRTLSYIEAPAHLDGGDILCLERKIYVGISERTDEAAIEQLGRLVTDLGYHVQPVKVTGCLHLKSAVTQIESRTVLINPEWVDPMVFGDAAVVEIDPTEPYAANAVRLDGAVLYSTSFPRTASRLKTAGLKTVLVESDELEKAEGALTCCSLLLEI